MHAHLDRNRFGPWALVTGASSGIGREIARQIAANGINVVLAARRRGLLERVGQELTQSYGVEHRIVALDLSEPDCIDVLAAATDQLDLGLVASNAGTAVVGRFLAHDRGELVRQMRLNAASHLEIAHHFGGRLARRGRGGLLLSGAMGAIHGLPFMANESASKAYVQTIGEALHVEFAPLGVNVTVLVIGPTDTPIISKLGLDPATMPMKPMPAERCAYEGLDALRRNRATHISGRMNRVMNALMPAAVARRLMAKMLGAAAARKMPVLGAST